MTCRLADNFKEDVVPLRAEMPPPQTLDFLKRCCRFVNSEWSHATREAVPDGGFEQRFRESCVRHLRGWTISEQREFQLDASLVTLSGALHEVDIVAKTDGATAIAELKNVGGGPGKNDIIVFYAKILDYLLANPDLVYDDVCLAFISRSTFDPNGLAACLGLGVHPVASDIRPLPVLINNAMGMQVELDKGLQVSQDTLSHFEDFCANLNWMDSVLQETWLNRRFHYLSSDDGLLIRAVEPVDVHDLERALRQANSDCIAIYVAFQHAQRAGEWLK